MKLLIALLCLFSISVYSFDLSEEISQLNQEYGRILDHPIIIFDKKEVLPLIRNLNDREARKFLISYVQEKFDVEITENEAHNFLPYFRTINGSAVALPSLIDYRSKKMKFCAVFPNGVENSLEDEVKRMLDYSPEYDFYGDFDFKKIEKLFTLEELRLFSLYHELSHCLDEVFLPENYMYEPSAHGLHLSESFAEVNALFLLFQRKGMKKLGIKRSILRTAYTKHMGPAIANKVTVFESPVVKASGSIYFLSPILIAAQRLIENYSVKVDELDIFQTIALSKEVVDHHAINSRSFQALVLRMRDGMEEAKKHYKKMAALSPELFLAAYLDLIYFDVFIEESL